MNFYSKPCTTLQQSKQLLNLGLKKETADMFYEIDEYGGTAYVLYADISNGWDDDYIPAWSLHRLIELLPVAITSPKPCQLVMHPTCIVYEDKDGQRVEWSSFYNMYDRIIHLLSVVIRLGQFNKEYLEERV